MLICWHKRPTQELRLRLVLLELGRLYLMTRRVKTLRVYLLVGLFLRLMFLFRRG